MIIYFGSDHAGFEMKNELLLYVKDVMGCEVVDCGATTFDADDDYPDFVSPAALAVSESPHSRKAIILGGSGQGEAMCANRYAHVRAVVYYGSEPDIIRLSREHNDANVLSLGARFLTISEAKKVVHTWLLTAFKGDARHTRRISKLK
jgi:ribose 5-phosphate isomerase B